VLAFLFAINNITIYRWNHPISAFSGWMSNLGAKENIPRFGRPGVRPGCVPY
jgi:hypothetical protein